MNCFTSSLVTTSEIAWVRGTNIFIPGCYSIGCFMSLYILVKGNPVSYSKRHWEQLICMKIGIYSFWYSFELGEIDNIVRLESDLGGDW